MSGPGGIIIRDIAKKLRDEAKAKTLEAHGWLGTQWVYLKEAWVGAAVVAVVAGVVGHLI